MGVLRAGFAKVDVTPTEPVVMAGYDLREAPSEGVHEGDRLFVRALVFDDGATRVAFVEADVIIIREVDGFRRRISEATGIPFDHVLLGDAHNHAAPSPTSVAETPWDERFGAAAVQATQDALTRLAPASVAAASGRARIAMNRRFRSAEDAWSELTFDENYRSQSFGPTATLEPVPIFAPRGVVRLGRNLEGPVDDELQVVLVLGVDGGPIAAMIHHACHGTSLGGRNPLISGDWMGRMLAHVEERIPGIGAMFVQGAAGDINPRVVGGLDGYVDDIATTHALGDEVGREVVRVIRSLPTQGSANDARIEVRTAEIALPRAYRELFDDFRNTTVPTTTTAVRIGDFMWVTFPGEMFHEIGMRVKQACPAPVAHLMGYTNGYIGYFPTRAAFGEGGYEPAVSHLDPAAEDTYLREVTRLLRGFDAAVDDKS